ncbi:TonB-dependent receptor [Denitratisoma sp. DHT3]|uniref:TonB-dependent receptor n=1 Tax=Denitratisoma sp. DHT3 TaxID=1981880 RepID=UPI0016473311|nr:TonB-dependent receptor [Denitratisoma sp. DHT3]
MRDKKSALPTLAVRALPLLIAAAYAGGAIADETKLEEVIITAQKRAERLQDVPISISAISGSQLETRGIEGSKDLSSLAPNLMVSYGNSGNSTMSIISIRGSGSGSPSIFLDTAVGTYVDGVYAGKNQGGLFDIVDLERVEVLRGPQGTLFGRNTLAGAINFVTKKPSGVFGGTVSLDVGNHGANVQRVAIDLPRMGALNLSLAARNETRDGYVSNATTGKDAGKVDKQSYRLAATLDVTPKFQANYTFDHTDVDNTPLPVSLYTPYGWKGPVTTNTSANNAYAQRAAIIAGASTSFPSSRNTTPGIAEWEKMKTDNHALTLSYQVNSNNTVKYIYSNRHMDWSDSLDLDGVTANIYAYRRTTQLQTDSHELQWVGSSGNLNYVAGYYAYKERSHTYNPQTSGGGFNFATDFSGSVEAKALFAQLDYAFNDKWSGSLGVRRSIDEKGVDSSQYGTGTTFDGAMTAAGLPAFINLGTLIPVTTSLGDPLSVIAPGVALDYAKQPTGATTVAYPAVFHAVAKKSFASTTPALSLTYKFNDGFNVYGRIAKGFRSGGFAAEAGGGSVAQVTAARTTPFNPEKSTTTELGFKATLLDGKAKINGALYQNKITDLQTNQLVAGTTSSIIVNAGKATYQGLELEGQFVVADGWRVGASWGYIDAKFDQYMDNGLNNGGALIDTASNRTPAYAPKHTINLNVDGRIAKTAWGTLRGVVDVTYTDKMYNLAGNKSLAAPNAGGANDAEMCLIPSKTLVNARLTLAGVPVGGPGRADVSLWVRNLANVRKPVNYIDLSYYRVATWTEPRMVGLSFGYKW